MDVRCEKCQTEYELDEARLKPGGVTVKCTNCGHMFKIRRRAITNVGLSPDGRDAAAAMRARTSSSKPLPSPVSVSPRAPARPSDSLFDDERSLGADEAPTTVERQWLIRLENGEQKSCRELATLQQWIVSGVVTRESLISRTGKTWKRLGDIADLGQYFVIADEARANRDRAKPSSRPAPIGEGRSRGVGTPTASPAGRVPSPAGPIASIKEIPGTLPGYSAAQAAGGTILPDDDDDGPESRTTRAYQSRSVANTPPPVPTRGVARSPAPVSNTPIAPTEPAVLSPQPGRQPRTTPPPPPPPPKRAGAAPAAQPPAIPPPLGNRATAAWATDGVKPDASALPSSAQSGPFVGKLAAIPDEPAFAGRVRIAPGDAASFDSSRVRALDDDDDLLPARRGSRAGMWVLIMALLVMGVSAAAVYLFVLRTGRDEPAARPAKDAGAAPVAVTATPDASAIAPPPPPVAADAAAVEAAPAQSGPRGELAADLEPRLRTAVQSLDGKLDAPSQALRAHLIAQLAQDLQDRAALIASPQADNLRKEAKQLVLDAATAAQRALRAAADDAGANIAMAEVLRLQGKPVRDVKRYLDMARAKPDKDWARELALADALVLARDGKLDDARAGFAAIDQGDGKLETSGDVRARFHLALALASQGKAADARPLVETVLAAQPEHAGARALAGKLETQVARTDPLPPEVGAVGTDGAGRAHTASAHTASPVKEPGPPRTNPVAPGPASGAGGDSYDRLLARANAIADTSCAKAMELYTKALELKPNGVEALAGEGYCHIDAKQFASAFSKFRAAIAVSPRYEPALRGIAEAYQQQGRKEQAIEAYKAYLEVYPGSAAAKKQLERLGGDAPAPQAPPSNGNATPPAAPAAPTAPPPPAPAPPAPTPDPAAAGSGSG